MAIPNPSIPAYNKIIMITDQSDPSGLGLFSKCARNHASRLKPKYKPSSTPRQPKPPLQEQFKKKSRAHFGFDKQTSREQRQKIYKRDDAPPVGQYNPVVKKSSKYVWDILKAYTTSNKSSNTKLKPSSASVEPNRHVVMSKEPQETNIDASLSQQLQTHLTAVAKESSYSLKQSSHRSQCMVNMSRMTGRRENTNESVDWGNVNVMRSLQYIKGSISKNINFGRPKRDKMRSRVVNYASYDYDLDKVKPSKKGVINFGVTRGREDRTKPSANYSYQHYEYDSYVWQSTSTVFPNTKTHGVDFNKQTNRYKEQSHL